MKEADALLHVVRCFESGDVMGRCDPADDLALLELELCMADLDTVTRGIDRTGKKARTGDKDAIAEKETFEKAAALLEEGTPLRKVAWTDPELAHLRPLFLMTVKPMLFVANVDQEDLDGSSEAAQAVARYAEECGSQSMHLCGDLECELVGMDDDDEQEFMAELGIEELALPRLLRSAYDLLGLQTFFTAGPKEIRAWTIRKGDQGPAAAGVIHSDFEKNYIRAEVYSVDDLCEHHSEAAIKAAGKLRVEGRDYVMREGDVAHFLVGR